MKTQWMIGFTSETEGITVAAIADSTAGAVAALADQYGEGVVVLLHHTLEELRNTAAAVEEATADEASESLKAIAHVVTADEPAEDEGGGGEGDDDRAGTAGSDPAVEEGSRCRICGTPITEDRAKASRLTVGEERCTECIV